MSVCAHCDAFIWTVGGDWEHMDTDRAECEPSAREAFLERWAAT